jgi:hypothetical protein
MDYSNDQARGLQKELDRIRARTRILEELILLKCDIRDCPILVPLRDGWKAPKERYEMAVSFRYWGAGAFVVYGNSLENVRKAAAFYAAQKCDSPEKQDERIEDQSQLNRVVIDPDGRRLEIIGIEPIFHSGFLGETHYISDPVDCLSLSDVKAMPDWDWLNNAWNL